MRDQGLHALGWVALVALVLGLVAAAVLLAPWHLKFAVDAGELYEELYEQALAEAEDDTLGWLAALAARTMAAKPLPPEQIKSPSTSIGIEEGRGGSYPRPVPRPAPGK